MTRLSRAANHQLLNAVAATAHRCADEEQIDLFIVSSRIGPLPIDESGT